MSRRSPDDDDPSANETPSPADSAGGPGRTRDIPTGRIQRLVRMGHLSGTVSSSYLGQRIRSVFQNEESRSRDLLRTHLRNASRMAHTMGHLKGAVMKVGQMISLGDEELLPPEATEILKVLQSKAPFLPFAQIKARVEDELEGSIDELFDAFDEQPMAAASLGQVHRARLRGGGVEVAVKVQYPNIDKTIHSDLSNLRAMLTASGVFDRKFDPDPYFRELDEMLCEELDYVQEAVNLEEMRRLFGGRDDIQIPHYVPERSTERVFTMEMATGQHLDEFVANDPPREARNRAGGALLDLILEGFLCYRVLHADPQAGNFLFHPDGQVVLLDYGCIKRFEAPFVADYHRALQAHLAYDRDAVIAAYIDVGYIRRDAGRRTREALWAIADVYARPIARDREYEFGSEPLAEIGKNVAMRHPACLNFRPPRECIYLHRTLVGGYFVGVKLRTRGNFYRRVRGILERAE